MTDQGNNNPTQNKQGQQTQQGGNMPNKQNPQQTSVKSGTGQGSNQGSGNR